MASVARLKLAILLTLLVILLAATTIVNHDQIEGTTVGVATEPFPQHSIEESRGDKSVATHEDAVITSFNPEITHKSLSLSSHSLSHKTPETPERPTQANVTPTPEEAAGGGFALAYGYWEQLTSAIRNLQYLQCWAAKANLSVVEPFIRKSSLGLDYNSLKFSDIYDIDHWATLSSNNTLVSWERFLKTAPRNLIRVSIRYGASGQVTVQDERMYREGCTPPRKWDLLLTYLEKQGFRSVRQVCINFSHNKEFFLGEFNREIFGDHPPSRSTVLFSEWRGMGNSRVQVRDSGCQRVTAHVQVRPSQRMLHDADTYAEKYLGTPDYAAVMVRMEKARHVNRNVSSCFQLTLGLWKKMLEDTGVNSTFLSADMGRFGSASLRYAKENLNEEFQDFFAQIYDRHLTVHQWESTFQAVSDVSNPAYISVLQKALAARAKCLLLVGGGSFQRHALELYLKGHTERCIYLVEKCTDVKFRSSLHAELL